MLSSKTALQSIGAKADSSASGVRLIVETPHKDFVNHAMGKVVSLLEEEAVECVFEDIDEPLTKVIWGDGTEHGGPCGRSFSARP